MANYGQVFGTPFSVSASGTSVASASLAGTTATIYYITDVQGSSVSNAGTFALLTGATGTTILWQGQLGSVPYIHSWNTPIKGTIGGTVTLTVNGSSSTFANISGYQISAGPS